VAPAASKQIINLGSKKEYSIAQAAGILQEIVGGAQIEYLEMRHEVHAAYSTHQKSEDILGYHATSLCGLNMN